MTFAQELKEWRGERYQKQVYDLFGCTLDCYSKWEQGVNVPAKNVLSHCRWVMAADKAGMSFQQYYARYHQIIHKVAEEILNPKK